MSTAAVAVVDARPPRIWADWLAARGGIVLLFAGLFVFLTLPLAMLFVRSVQDKAGATVGLANFASYLASPVFARSGTEHADVRRADHRHRRAARLRHSRTRSSARASP
jgi:hypothetical protein